MMQQKRELIKAQKALAVAKSIKRKVVYLPRGITGEIFNDGFNNFRNKTKKLDHSEVLQCIKEGMPHKDLIQKFKVTSQAISYVKKKYKNEILNL